jgi:purine-nucleoside phosphorylase
MSTVPEVVAARANGMRVLGISTISNVAAGKSPGRLDHDDVLAAGAEVQGDLQALVQGVIQKL